MLYLLSASLIWAFSFGLIKGTLTGVDASLVSFIRMGVSFLIFAPFIRLKSLPPRLSLRLVIVGVVQYGLMYLFYIRSYQTLQAYQVALFTVFTPMYVALIDDAFEKKFNPLFLITAAFAVIGAGVISYREDSLHALLTGFLAVQASNLCFAFGQIYYKRILAKHHVSEFHLFGIVYFGAVIATGMVAGASYDPATFHLSGRQALTLLYLGAIASGLAFYLWNVGARRTDNGALAVFNNLKIPLAVVVSIFVFGEHGDMPRLAVGGGIIVLALLMNESLIKWRTRAA
jgi:drug/metabolite transporter (DMT)-like permease